MCGHVYLYMKGKCVKLNALFINVYHANVYLSSDREREGSESHYRFKVLTFSAANKKKRLYPITHTCTHTVHISIQTSNRPYNPKKRNGTRPPDRIGSDWLIFQADFKHKNTLSTWNFYNKSLIESRVECKKKQTTSVIKCRDERKQKDFVWFG